MGKTFTEKEIRERVLSLKGAYPARTIDVHELLDDLGIKLEPTKIEVEGYIFSHGEHAITLDDGSFAVPLRNAITQGFGGSGWGGTKVKLTIEEILEDE